MGEPSGLRQEGAQTSFHPYVARVFLGLAFLFVLGSWGFLSGSGYVGLVAIIVTFFTALVLAIPFALWRIKVRHDLRPQNRVEDTFRTWLSSRVEVWQDSMGGLEAMITALLPIAAAAFGALLLAIVFQVVTRTR